MDYIQLIEIKELYNSTSQSTIKNNIKRLMKSNKVKHSTLSQLLDISTHTSYSYTNISNKNKPELYNLLILSEYFNVSIRDILT